MKIVDVDVMNSFVEGTRQQFYEGFENAISWNGDQLWRGYIWLLPQAYRAGYEIGLRERLRDARREEGALCDECLHGSA